VDETSGVLKVAVIGAESTGKTTLCQWLSAGLDGLHFEEPLRQWVARKGRPPWQDEQLEIVEAQKQQELLGLQQATQTQHKKRWLFCDSAPLVTAAYSRYYFNDASLDNLASSHHQANYAATLFCLPQGLDWVAEPGQRDSPKAREAVHQILLELVKPINPDRLIFLSGGLRKRYEFALALLNRLHFDFARGPETS
jgi:nicotinamide riboside kinase